MTIAVLTPVEFRGWGGVPGQPAMPIGQWFKRVSLVGDASGGSKTLELAFSVSAPGSPLTADSFSLEQLSIHSTSNADATALVLTIALGRVNRGSLVPSGFDYAVELISIGGSSESAAQADMMAPLRGLFLGQPETSDSSATLGVRVTNVDLEVLTVEAQGYVWGPRSLSTPGGPLRPAGALFAR